jgi:hypothetical protein
MGDTSEEILNKAIEKAKKTQADDLESAGVSFLKILKELSTIGFSDIRDYVTIAEGGEIQAIPLDRMVKKKSRAIKKIKEHTQIKESSDGKALFKDSRVEYELYDKLDALKYLTKLGGWEPNPKMELTGKDGGPINLNYHIPGDNEEVKISET